MFMKKVLFLFAATLALASCSTQSKFCSSGPKNLIKNSEFAIVTPKYDTLILCEDEAMGRFLAQCWKEGKFKGEKAVVYLVDCDRFEKISQRVATGPDMFASENKP